jgi:hypothetical protein
MLTTDEYQRMVAEWGKRFTDEAIGQYDRKFPNSDAIRKHTDHNLGIRDYVGRGFICQGKTPHPEGKEVVKSEPSPEEIGTPEERARLLKLNFNPAPPGRSGVQPIGDVIASMMGNGDP